MPNVDRLDGFRRSGALRASYKSSSLKATLLSGASLALAASLSSSPAHAQASASGTTTPVVEEIVVTGTQIVRDGYQSPTPLTVVGVQDIETAAPNNLSDYLDKMPAMAGSTSGRSLGNSVSDGNGGVAALNLRFLGANRTLICSTACAWARPQKTVPARPAKSM